ETLPELRDATRTSYVLLLTDGLPNCNPANPNSCINAAACQCTLTGGNCVGQFCALGCLDQDGSVAAIQQLRAYGIFTIVIGFGSETTSGTAQPSSMRWPPRVASARWRTTRTTRTSSGPFSTTSGSRSLPDSPRSGPTPGSS